MSSKSEANDGRKAQNNFTPEVLGDEDDAALAESIRSADPETLEAVKEVMQETDSVLVCLDSTWWGNEAFGVWGKWFFIKPDSVSPSGKALFVDEGIKTSDPIGRIKSANRMLESRGGYTPKASRKTKRKAFNWFDDSAKPGPGTLSVDEREDSFKGESIPLSVISYSVRFPESQDDLVVETNEATHSGKMSEGDVSVTGTKRDKYGEKFVLSGDTYDALSSNGDDLSSEMSWDDTHCTFDGDDWVCDADSDALTEVVRVLVNNGYKVSIADEYAATFKRAGQLFE
jgi:hypothetical protein